MTIEEVKDKYGTKDDWRHSDGYVYCQDCPISEKYGHCVAEQCPEEFYRDGYWHCWEAIQKFMASNEEINEEINEEVNEVVNDMVNHPSHYCREGAMECIDEMILVFGKEAVKHFCLCNAWKYRYRASDKNGEEDIKKSDWYLKKYEALGGITIEREEDI